MLSENTEEEKIQHSTKKLKQINVLHNQMSWFLFSVNRLNVLARFKLFQKAWV